MTPRAQRGATISSCFLLERVAQEHDQNQRGCHHTGLQVKVLLVVLALLAGGPALAFEKRLAVTERMRAVDRVLDPFNKRAGGMDHYHEPTSNR
jgi:hypothetical protein